MNPLIERQALLEAVLAESLPGGVRAAMLDQTLRLARRRRRARAARRGAAWLGLGAMAATLLWLGWVGPRRGGRATAAVCPIMRSRPLPAAALVQTQPLPPGWVVRSTRAFMLVRTTPTSGPYRQLTDEELLALTSPHPAALVWRAPHEAELVLAEPTDQAPPTAN